MCCKAAQNEILQHVKSPNPKNSCRIIHWITKPVALKSCFKSRSSVPPQMGCLGAGVNVFLSRSIEMSAGKAPDVFPGGKRSTNSGPQPRKPHVYPSEGRDVEQLISETGRIKSSCGPKCRSLPSALCYCSSMLS